MPDIGTRHHSESGPVAGFVYLALRDDERSVKVGSTVATPASRLSETPTCSSDGFLIACWTSAVRELEAYLHAVLADAGLKLEGRDNFALTVETVMVLADWFNGGCFSVEMGGDDGILTLVDRFGRPPDEGAEAAKLLAAAARLAVTAEIRRALRERAESKRRQASILADWTARTATAWSVSTWELNRSIGDGLLDREMELVRAQVRAGRFPRVPKKPAHVDVGGSRPRQAWNHEESPMLDALDDSQFPWLA